MLEYIGYIDPSIFSSMIAIVVAALVSVGMTFRVFWARIKNRLKNN